MRLQNGGSIVFIGSKNALAATPNARAYASAKAASVHLARCLALEGAPSPEFASMSSIPMRSSAAREFGTAIGARSVPSAYGVDAGEELEEFYRKRSLLKQNVLPEDIAEADIFLGLRRVGEITGNIINVDAGNAQAFTR